MCGENKKREGEGEEERRRVGTFTLFTHKKKS
jgi:hypothetical protein